MSAPLFTKGPWSVETDLPHGEQPRVYGGDDAGSLIAVFGNAEVDKQDEWEANARLCASALDLYAELDVREGDLFMLRRAVEEGDPKAELLIRIDDMLRETRAALSKARGEQS